MKIVDIYLIRSVLLGIFIALLVICGVDWLGDLFYEVGRMSTSEKFSDVLLLTILDIPHKFFEFLPSSMLIGTLFSLGQFASTSELVAVGASGYSRLRVGLIACVAGLLITVMLTIFVETYMPYGERLSLSFQQNSKENVLLTSDESYWVRDQTRFIRIGQAVSKNLLRNVEIYQFDEAGELQKISTIENAVKLQDEWQLKNYRSSGFADDSVQVENIETHVVANLYFNNLLQSVTSDPFKMSIQRLYEYISYLEENHLDAREYHVALFKRIAIPFVGLAMLLLALPLVFRPRQLGGAGQRLLVGIVIALVVFILVEAITNGAVVYKFPPILVAFLPVLIILLCSSVMFKMTR